MAVSTFGVTAAIEREDMFPQWGAFDANSSPTATAVGRFISEEAGDLAGKLYMENVNAAAIVDTSSAAYLWCAKTLKLMVAVRIFAVTTQGDPELRKAYRDELKVRLQALADGGATALGDDALDTGDAPADGPTTHINQFRLTTSSADDMSPLDDPLRRSDRL